MIREITDEETLELCQQGYTYQSAYGGHSGPVKGPIIIRVGSINYFCSDERCPELSSIKDKLKDEIQKLGYE